MKIRKTIKNKLKISIIIVMMAGLLFAKTVSAKTFLEAAGGKLMKPVLNFAMFIGDTIENALDGSLYDKANRPIRYKSNSGRTANAIDNVIIDSFWDPSLHDIDESGWSEYAFDKRITLEPLNRKLDKTIFTLDTLDRPFGPVYSPYEIFSNKIPLMDVNFLSPNLYINAHPSEGEDMVLESSASILQTVVSRWYVALRNVAIVALLSILLYLGIRIVISSSSAEKALYKQTLLDWFIALILIFGMHYIMSFALTVTESISEILNNTTNRLIVVPVNISSQVNDWQVEFKLVTNLTGYVRLVAGIANSQENTLLAVEYAIIYLIMIAYTVMFTIIYLKRVIYMAFLTIIAPLTAVTYPFRKKNGPGGNAFAVWFREYIVNLLIQPLHLLLYSVVIGSTMELAVEHPIYAIVALACLIPAQKLFFEIFGIRAPQYADTERTMQTEKKYGMKAINLTEKAVKGAARGIRMITGTVIGGVAGGIAAGAAKATGSGLEGTEGATESIESGEGMQVVRLSSSTNSTSKNQYSSNSGTSSTSTNISGYGEENSEQYTNAVNSSSNKSEQLNHEYIQCAISKSIVNTASGQVQINSQNAEINNEFSGSNENNIKVRNMNTKLNFDQVMNDVYPEYEKNGISDIREFNATYALEESGISREEAIATYRIAKENGDIRGNEEAQIQLKNKLVEQISNNTEIKQIIESKSNEINTKYSKLEKEAKEKYKNKNSSDPEYRELSRKMDEMLERIKSNKNDEIDQVKQIPIRFADQIIARVENYYNKLD